MGITLHRPAPPTNKVGKPVGFASSKASSTVGSDWTGDIIRVRKENPDKEKAKSYRVDDLPYGPNGGRKWRYEYTPIILAWAGSQEDPFAVNNHMDLYDVMTKAWEHAYPAFTLSDAIMEILEKLVSLSCRNPAPLSNRF
jgi:hypothetical protein